jgi:probable phosphoglycerate mutase
VATTIFLVRHAAHGQLGRVLSGRAPGLALSPEGRAQAVTLAARLRGAGVEAVYSSPIQRALETAEPAAAALGRPVQPMEEITEIDFGTWTGQAFSDLDTDPRWHAWNVARGLSRAPDGESMLEAQARAVAGLDRITHAHPGAVVALVSHADVIKAMLCAVLGLPLDSLHRFEIDPASVSRVVMGAWGAKVASMNEGWAA